MIKNAKIDKTKLGFEDGSQWFTCWLYLDYGDSTHQGFGGYGLGPKWGVQFIKELMKTVGVEEWENLVGKYIRVEVAESKRMGFGHEIIKIGHITEDKWLCPFELSKKLGIEK
jgi:hypothetical protein